MFFSITFFFLLVEIPSQNRWKGLLSLLLMVLVPYKSDECVFSYGKFIFNCGATLIAARSTARYRDVKNILPFMFRLLFYGSGVLFSVDAYVTNQLVRNLFVLNPMFNILEIYRWSILGGDIAAIEILALFLWTFILFYFGFFWFRKGEFSYGI